MLRVLPPSKKNPCNLVCCKTCSNVVGKTRNIAIQLIFQQSRQTSCAFYCTVRRDSVGSSLKQSYNAISYRTDPVPRTILRGLLAKMRAKVRQFTGHLLTVNRLGPLQARGLVFNDYPFFIYQELKVNDEFKRTVCAKRHRCFA